MFQLENLKENAEERHRLLFQNALVGLHRVRLGDGAIVACNDAAAELLGYTDSESLMHRGVLKQILLENEYDRFLDTLNEKRLVKSFETQAHKTDGTVIWVELSARIDADDEHAEGAIADVTERRRAEENLLQSNAENVAALQRERKAAVELEDTLCHLRAAMQEAKAATLAKSQFLANMSHEIRTPMTAILGYAENLLDPRVSESERRTAVQTIQQNGQYLLRIINDILDLSKVEAGKISMEFAKADLCTIVDEVVSLVAVKADDRRLLLDTEYIGAIPETIRTDPTRLRQILINLLGNAIKFTQIGGVKLSIRLINDAASPYIQFDIEDTGVGMTEEQITRLFQPFTQADPSTTRQFGGTGLGLVISKRFAEMLGGDISVVDSKPKVGTCFRATIGTGPLDNVTMLNNPVFRPTTPDETTGVSTTLQHDLQQCHILLAEDNPTNRILVAGILKKANARITAVGNGQLAVDAVDAALDRSEPFDAILMDLQMPVMDGYKATRMLREKGYSSPIIALTAHAMDGDRDKCIEAGCDDYATKPINRRKLLDMIQDHVAHSAKSPTH